MIGDTIRKIRLLKKYSGAKLSKIIGIEKNTLSNIEKNKYFTTKHEYIQIICNEFNITLDFFSKEVQLNNIVMEIFKRIFGAELNHLELVDKEKILFRFIDSPVKETSIIKYNKHLLEIVLERNKILKEDYKY